jgi:hypothetical protein
MLARIHRLSFIHLRFLPFRYMATLALTGGPFNREFEICVELERGQAGFSKIAPLNQIYKPTAAGVAKV